jgi:iron-sulfur cluster assembly protein
MGITITEKAANEVKRIIADQKLEPETLLRVGVTGGGCSGFSYVLGFDAETKDDDQVLEFGDLKVVMGADAEPYLDNTIIDFNDDVTRRGFVFNNPNASGTCGCGSSFSV